MKTGSLTEDRSVNNASLACLQLLYQSLKPRHSEVLLLCAVASSKVHVVPICTCMCACLFQSSD